MALVTTVSVWTDSKTATTKTPALGRGFFMPAFLVLFIIHSSQHSSSKLLTCVTYLQLSALLFLHMNEQEGVTSFPNEESGISFLIFLSELTGIFDNLQHLATHKVEAGGHTQLQKANEIAV